MTTPVRLAVLTTHPVQYFAPLLRRIAAEPDIELTVFYGSDLTAGNFLDPGFGREIAWDVPLLDGYRSEFLTSWGGKGPIGLWRPFSRGLATRLAQGRFQWLLIHGYSRPAHWLAAIEARRLGVKVLVRDEATLISRRRGPAKRLLKRIFFMLLDRLVDGYLAIGTLNRDYYIAHGIAADRLFLMPYAVDNARFQAADPMAGTRLRRALGIPERAPVILFASKLQSRKHPDDLLAAFLRLRQRPDAGDPHLILAGDGALMTELRRRTEGMADVHFLGFRNQSELLACYAACDVFVLPSTEEPWGLVVNEAMNLGKAVIVSDQVGCCPDLVSHGVNGFVFEAGDIGALAEHLRTLCREPDVARAMGHTGRERIARWDFEADVRGLREALNLAPSIAEGGSASSGQQVKPEKQP